MVTAPSRAVKMEPSGHSGKEPAHTVRFAGRWALLPGGRTDAAERDRLTRTLQNVPGENQMSTPFASREASKSILSATILATLTLLIAISPSRSAPLHPVGPLSVQDNAVATVLIPVRAAVRGGSVRVGPRGGAVVHRGGAVVGPRGGAAVRRTAVVGPRGNVAVRNTAVVGGGGRWAR